MNQRTFNRFRGGSLSEQDHTDTLLDTKEERFYRRGMSLALASAYFAVKGAKCALPSVLALLTSSQHGMTFSTTTTPQNQMANLLGLSTIAIASGKLLLGPLIDMLGGIQSLQLSLSALVCLLTIISTTQKFTHFALAWIVVDFIFSACWAASINSIHQCFPETEWGQQIGYLATGARMGNTASFSLFAYILYVCERHHMKQPWRSVFLVSALLQIIPLSFLTYFGRGMLRHNQASQEKVSVLNPQSPQSSTVTTNALQILMHEARSSPEFWLHLLSRACLTIFASFLLFVPTFMSQVYRTSNAVAAQVASIYSLGCLVAVSTGSQRYASLSKRRQIITIILLLSLATACSLMQLAYVSNVLPFSVNVAALSMFVWGFAFSIPFYLPSSLYALERGGGKGSATISDAFDFLGFAWLAIFNGYVASLPHSQPISWIGCFKITSLCSMIALLAQPLAVLRQ